MKIKILKKEAGVSTSEVVFRRGWPNGDDRIEIVKAVYEMDAMDEHSIRNEEDVTATVTGEPEVLQQIYKILASFYDAPSRTSFSGQDPHPPVMNISAQQEQLKRMIESLEQSLKSEQSHWEGRETNFARARIQEMKTELAGLRARQTRLSEGHPVGSY